MFRDYFDPFGLVRSQTVGYAIAHYSQRLADVLEHPSVAGTPAAALAS